MSTVGMDFIHQPGNVAEITDVKTAIPSLASRLLGDPHRFSYWHRPRQTWYQRTWHYRMPPPWLLWLLRVRGVSMVAPLGRRGPIRLRLYWPGIRWVSLPWPYRSK